MIKKSDNMFQRLPPDVVRKVYGFDPTYHDIYKSVVREYRVNCELAFLFKHEWFEVVENPQLLRSYVKTDFEQYARFLGLNVGSKAVGQGAALHLTSRKLTRRRLLRKLLCHHLQEQHVYELDINSVWVLS